jgi:hypothetical protein
MDDVVRDTWKLREIAPPSAAPHFGGPLQAWSAALRTLSPMLRDLATELRGQNLEDIVFPHFLSGPLDARQRLEFLAFHLRRHHAQVQRVVASPGFPGSSRP